MANGLYTNDELIDSLIVDCNESVKAITSGQMVLWCKIVYEMVVKLQNLKKGVADELKNREENIETLKEQLRNVGATVEDISVDELGEATNAEQ